MNGAESLVRTLIACGVEVCFANPGTSEMHLLAALDRMPGTRAVLGLFEGVVTGAADGYARMAGKPAITLLHLGPGGPLRDPGCDGRGSVAAGGTLAAATGPALRASAPAGAGGMARNPARRSSLRQITTAPRSTAASRPRSISWRPSRYALTAPATNIAKPRANRETRPTLINSPAQDEVVQRGGFGLRKTRASAASARTAAQVNRPPRANMSFPFFECDEQPCGPGEPAAGSALVAYGSSRGTGLRPMLKCAAQAASGVGRGGSSTMSSGVAAGSALEPAAALAAP
jgi:Thiamine pyrophosphate enzyme, N-terminal TPP binding domain